MNASSEPTLSILAAAAVLALLAGTIRAVRTNLIRYTENRTPVGSYKIFGWLESAFWIGALLAIIVAVPHPMTIVVVSLFVVSILVAIRLRYREERRSLNRWIGLASIVEVSLPGLLYAAARGCRSRIALEARDCGDRLNRGEAIANAIRYSKLPLDPGPIAAIVIPHAGQETLEDSLNVIRMPQSDIPLDSAAESKPLSALVPQHFAYIVLMLVLAWCIGMLVRSTLVPMLSEIADDMTLSRAYSSASLETVAMFGHLFMIVLVAWLVFAALIPLLPSFLVNWVPWFGRLASDRGRCEILDVIQRGMHAGQSDLQIFDAARHITSARWARSRCGVMHQMVQGGTPLSSALQSAKMVSSREHRWLVCAEKNGTLPDALAKLSGDIERRQTHRWRIRMAWAVPLTTVLVGIFVLAHAVYLFQFLVLVLQRIA